MDAGPSAVILFVCRPASDARSRKLVVTPVPGGATVAAAVILSVRRLASNSRTLLLNAVSGGAAITSAVILFVRRPASNSRSGRLVLTPVSGGAAVTRASARLGSKLPEDV